MDQREIPRLCRVEGRRVSLALVDGTRIDDATLVSAGRGPADLLWIFTGGADVFVRVSDVVDWWEPSSVRC